MPLDETSRRDDSTHSKGWKAPFISKFYVALLYNFNALKLYNNITKLSCLLSKVMRRASLPFRLKAYSTAWWTETAISGFLEKCEAIWGVEGGCGKDGVVLQRDVLCCHTKLARRHRRVLQIHVRHGSTGLSLAHSLLIYDVPKSKTLKLC